MAKMCIVIIAESISVLFLFTSSHHYHGNQCYSEVLLKHHRYRSGHVRPAGYNFVGLFPITEMIDNLPKIDKSNLTSEIG